MVIYRTGDIFECLKEGVEVIVNPVNCWGVMGKGLALAFKEKFPGYYWHYVEECRHGKIAVNRGSIYYTSSNEAKFIIYSFATKDNWRHSSSLETIKLGLKGLISNVKFLEIKSIAIPALGCGNGGLDWLDVKPLIEKAFKKLPDIDVYLYGPLEGN